VKNNYKYHARGCQKIDIKIGKSLGIAERNL
jgi:hypothetical protein